MRWLRDQWALGRWCFVTMFVIGLTFSALAWIGGIMAILDHPPPGAALLLIGLFGVTFLWHRNQSPDDEPMDDDEPEPDTDEEYTSGPATSTSVLR